MFLEYFSRRSPLQKRISTFLVPLNLQLQRNLHVINSLRSTTESPRTPLEPLLLLQPPLLLLLQPPLLLLLQPPLLLLLQPPLLLPADPNFRVEVGTYFLIKTNSFRTILIYSVTYRVHIHACINISIDIILLASISYEFVHILYNYKYICI